jgi:aryl-alcohol dehydrogenase-like predicted oxidoreductase
MAVRAARSSQAVSNQVTAAVNPHLPLARRGETLSRKALWVLLSTPGVTTVLLGMRHPDYVADGMEVLRWAPLGDARKIYDGVAAGRIG